MRKDGGRPRSGYGAINHYPLMDTEEICNLDVAELSDDNCALFLWATFPRLPEAFRVIEAWGFSYRTVGFIWIKLNSKRAQSDMLFPGSPIEFMNWMTVFGIGYYTKHNPEVCLLGIKGRMKPVDNTISNVVYYPRGEHSAKPPIVRDKIVQLFGDLPRIELFAREKTPGWSSWGNEITSDLEVSYNAITEEE